jgi:alpha-L-rhamnosidase
LHLDVELKDGKSLSVVSDDSWQKALQVPLESSDILDGEIYDARKDMKDWDSPDFKGKGWQNVEADANLGAAKLVWQPNEPIRVVKEIVPLSH